MNSLFFPTGLPPACTCKLLKSNAAIKTTIIAFSGLNVGFSKLVKVQFMLYWFTAPNYPTSILIYTRQAREKLRVLN